MNREKEASRRRAKHEEINKSTSEAVSWVEKWKKTIDVEGWRITGAGRRATAVRANEFETGLCIYIYMRDSVFVLLLLIPLASFKCKNSKGKRIFSLAIERGIDLFSCATSGNGKGAFSRGGTEIQPLWKAEDTLIFERGIRACVRRGEYLPRFFRFEFITDRYGNLEFEMDG